jgi:hypothetical protein
MSAKNASVYADLQNEIYEALGLDSECFGDSFVKIASCEKSNAEYKNKYLEMAQNHLKNNSK